mmetsp:Transcript_21763/g.61778  ORF Transcript_21763/g.61778 Transcript_21763/m.61778 type:complete len:232 (+) Transcript_21763:56-751(+)
MGDGSWRSPSPACSESSKPGFLQPAYDLHTPGGRRPPRLPVDPDQAASEKGSAIRGTPDMVRPSTPLSSRASSPLQRRLAGASPNNSLGTPRGSSRGASSTGAPSSAGSCGFGPLGGTGSLAGTTSRPGTGASRSGGEAVALDPETAKQLEMLEQGYLPSQEYIGIMALNKELREQNKRLHAELVTLRVEHERLRMEEGFLRGSALKADLQPPPEVGLRACERPEDPGSLT